MTNNSLAVLIIDNKGETDSHLPDIIENGGHTFAVSNSCDDAVLKLSQFYFDVIFADVNITDCDGVEFMLRLSTQYPGRLIVALTDRLSRLEEIKIRKSRVSCILIKPFTTYDIQGILDHAVRRKKMMSCKPFNSEARLFGENHCDLS